MPHEIPTSDLLISIARAHQAFTGLMQFAPAGETPSLGGQLLYAGELGDGSRSAIVAANIAGAATLAASANPAALRQAQHNGVIDFLVNSLDEALRILKNELRKRQPVAVGVSLAPVVVEDEMIDRGVLPNLLPPQAGGQPQTLAASTFLAQGAQQFHAQSQAHGLLIWLAPAEFAQNPGRFESTIADQLAPSDQLNRRWLHLSPRYLGHDARRLRSVACDEQTAVKLSALLGSPLSPNQQTFPLFPNP